MVVNLDEESEEALVWLYLYVGDGQLYRQCSN